MKLITLNTWAGRIKDPLEKFLDTYKNDTDIWCFQEVYRGRRDETRDGIDRSDVNFHLYQSLQEYLPGYQHDFCQILDDKYGLAAFLKHEISIEEKGEMLVARGNWHDFSDLQNRDLHRKAQWLDTRINGKQVLIVNVHFTHRPEGKQDSEKRLNQSWLVASLLNMFDCPKILCGDFNLLPNTESIKIIEAAGMRNLVKEYGITSTRTELYKKSLPFADYIFVSPEIKVNDFKVLQDVVSDHSPLYLDFEV